MCSRSTGYCTEHVRTGELWSQVDEERVCAVVAQVVEQVRGGRLTHRQLPLVE